MTPKEVDDAILAWHASDSDKELHEWLGVTLEEYKECLDHSTGYRHHAANLARVINAKART